MQFSFEEIINAALVLSAVVWLYKRYHVPVFETVLVLLHFALIFVLNNVLFPVSYMSDQLAYLEWIQKIRAQGLANIQLDYTVHLASYIFSFFPFPYIKSVYSIAFINWFIYAILFLFLFKRGILRGAATWFFLLFPSLALYAGVGLRDILILAVMLASAYIILTRRNLWLGLLILAPLYVLKLQNLVIVAGALIIVGLLHIREFGWPERIVLVVAAIAGIALVLFKASPEFLHALRYYMAVHENGVAPELVQPINNYWDAVWLGFLGAFNFMIAPWPWEFQKSLHVIQFMENIAVMAGLVYLLVKAVKTRLVLDFRFQFLSVMLILMAVFYGLVIFNSGTASRYRFTFEVVYFVFVFWLFRTQKEVRTT